ncbi:hypothetical protein RI367_002357 [Sorochytrium milnesiophthora]
MLYYLLISAVLYAAYHTNRTCTVESLHQHLRSSGSTAAESGNGSASGSRGVMGFLGRLFSPDSSSLPTVHLHDYVFFTLADVDSGAQYVYCFGQWFTLSTVETTTGDAASAEGQADAHITLANGYKRSQDYAKAAEEFVKAAECWTASSTEGSEEAATEACNHYTDAYRCYNHPSCQNSERAMWCLASACNQAVRAAQLGNQRPSLRSRCARMYDTMGQYMKAQRRPDKALQAYQKMVEYLDDDQERVFHARVHVADLYASTEQYAAAIETYEQLARHAVEQPILAGRLTEFLAGACWATAGMGLDQLSSRLTTYADAYPSWTMSDASRWFMRLAQLYDNGIEGESDIAQLKEQAARRPLEQWKTNVLERCCAELLKARESLC